MTMSTIVNSDMIPFKKRGMYQALQNAMFGFGAICGASFGGSIADSIGWRWCFLLQVPISAVALLLGWLVITNPTEIRPSWSEIKEKVDFAGALLLVVAISMQLVGLSLGGNELPWSNGWVISSLVVSFVLLAIFFWVEAKTTAIPVIPLRQLVGRNPIAIQTANLCAGTAAYAVGQTKALYGPLLIRCLVPIYATTVLPGGSSGYGHNGGRPSCNSVRCHADRRSCGRCSHVSLGKPGHLGAYRCSLHDAWERSSHFTLVQRQQVEVFGFHFSCQPWPGHYISCDIILNACLFQSLW
jgi:MFS family permease